MNAGRPARSTFFVAILLLGFLCPGRAQTYEGRELVHASLLVDVNAVVPGKPFTVGLLLRMVPNWHTYWKFPGDAGIPTEIKWKLPPGWKAGEIQWPIPLRLNEPGDILIYGYHDEVLLLQEITPPASLSEPKVQLPAEANWLVCEKICIPGGAKLQLDLPVAAQNAPANEEIFSRYRRSLPQSWPDPKIASASWKRNGPELQLSVESAVLANYPVAEFFPLPEGNVVVGHPKTERDSGGKTTFRVPIETEDQKLSALNGLVVFGPDENGPGRNAWSFTGNSAAAVISSSAPVMSGNIAKFLLFGFLGGFILNLMPCVLPVISLKIFGFIQHAGQDRRRILRSGLAFIAGIFAWFIGLAVLLIILKSAGREITWAFQFTNPYFVLGMSAVVLVFALNLFGVFEISLPQSANRGLLGWTAREGDAGSFFQGVFATVLATPCTAPFLAPALGFAFTQSGWMILLMFLAIAAGMSSPYLLLSAQPAWLRLLPRPGPWMLRVKQLMGFLLIATLLFLLWVLGAQRGVDAILWASCFLLALSIACWMKGSFLVPTASLTSRLIALVLVLVLVLGSAWYFIGEKFRSTKLISSTDTPTQGDWQPFTPQRLENELKQGRAVFVDFTAAWCLTCKFNEATVLESSAVRDAFQRHGIVKIKADWTNADPAITKILKQFGRPGVPMYVLYPGRNAEPFLFPELLTQSLILEKLETISPHVAAE